MNKKTEQIELTDTLKSALIQAVKGTLAKSKALAESLRECYKHLLPRAVIEVGQKAKKCTVEDVAMATAEINKALRDCPDFVEATADGKGIKLTDSIKSQVNYAKNTLGLPKRAITRADSADKTDSEDSGTAEGEETAEGIEIPTAKRMEQAEWSTEQIRHALAQCLIALSADKEGFEESVNLALREAKSGFKLAKAS